MVLGFFLNRVVYDGSYEGSGGGIRYSCTFLPHFIIQLAVISLVGMGYDQLVTAKPVSISRAVKPLVYFLDIYDVMARLRKPVIKIENDFFFLGYFIFFLSCSAYCGIRISSQINRWFSEFGLIEYDITLILNIKYEFQWICVGSISLSH